MLIPYGTDAPVYHFPFATIGVIVINTVMFCATGMGYDPSYDWLILEYDKINPLQWVTAAFMHASWGHLIGNMIFLWCFGLVVEGKLGWARFSWLYLGLALADGAIGQIPMFLIFDSCGGALGASGVIFALMAVSLVWAPQNDMHCLFVGSFFFVRTIDVPIFALGLFYFAVELLMLAIGGFHMSSEMLHLLGMSVGFPFAIYMLRKDLVDCEGWDIFSRYGHLRENHTSLNPLLLVGSMFGERSASSKANLLRQAYAPSGSGQDALKLIRENPDQFNPAPKAPKETFVAAVQSLSRAIASHNHRKAGEVFDRISDRWGLSGLDDATLARYANLMSLCKLHLRCLQPLGLLVARRSRHTNSACIRMALIQLRVQRRPSQATETLHRMLRPWNTKLEMQRNRLLHEARTAMTTN